MTDNHLLPFFGNYQIFNFKNISNTIVLFLHSCANYYIPVVWPKKWPQYFDLFPESFKCGLLMNTGSLEKKIL